VGNIAPEEAHRRALQEARERAIAFAVEIGVQVGCEAEIGDG
jgi:hypothetical protein